MLKSIERQSGFTMMELMVVIAILAVTAFLAVPSINSSYTRSELNAAQQNIAQSLRKAKQFARSINTTITVTLTQNQNNNTAAFTLPDGSNQLPDGIKLSPITLPGSVSVSSGD